MSDQRPQCSFSQSPLIHLPLAVVEMGSIASLRGYVLISIVEEHGDRVMAPNIGLLLLFHKKSEVFFFFSG